MDNVTNHLAPESLNENETERERERERERSWVRLADEYNFSDADKANGLKDFLDESKNAAVEAVGNLFSEIGLEPEKYQFVLDAPLGLDQEDDVPGAYYPGEYGIVIGRQSEEVEAFLDGNRSEKLKNTFARTMIHEMVHMMLTDNSLYLPDGFDTVGDTVMGWHGLEEGMAEAIGQIAMKKSLKGLSLKETAADCEAFCAEHDAPATQIAARLIGKAGPNFLKWFLTSTQTGECHTNNKIERAFGPSYRPFLENTLKLLDYEEEILDLTADHKDSLVNQTVAIIDENAEKLA